MYEKQQGLLPDGKTHIPMEAREAFVDMFPRLKAANYDDDACTAVLNMLILGVEKESLKQQLPTLTKTPSSTTRLIKKLSV